MNGMDYQKLAMRTNDGKADYRLNKKISESIDDDIDFGGILNGCFGLAGETGEFLDMIKKWVFHEKELDREHAMKELGDVMWYVAMICHSFGWDLDVIMLKNVTKLKNRYPKGFDTDMSNHRKEGDL